MMKGIACAMLLAVTACVLNAAVTPHPTTTTPPPPPGLCQEGEWQGYHTCSFICGLNDQWFPKTLGGSEVPGSQNCTTKGRIVYGECPMVCYEGQWGVAPCMRCCVDYSDNHCDLDCGGGLQAWDCDPFSPPTTPTPWTPTPATRPALNNEL